MSSLRILYHHRTLGDGAEGIHIREMVSALRNLGHEVRVVSLIGEHVESRQTGSSAKQQVWSWISRFLPGLMYECAEVGYNFVGQRSVSRAIREFQPDLVYDRYNSYNTAAVRAAKKAGVPVFLEVNGPVAYERANYEHRPLRLQKLAERYERWICNAADHVFAVSTPLRDFLVNSRNVSASRVTVLPNGVNPEHFDAVCDGNSIKERLGIKARTVIGFVGILRPWHGLNLLLEAFTALVSRGYPVHLLIVGDGPIEESLKQQVKALRIEGRVSFTGRVPHGEVQKYVAAMDIAVSPRATFYASPMKILEYMAMGLATVAPDTANIRDLLTDGEDCVLFEAENKQSLLNAIERLVANSDQAKRMGLTARKKVETQRNWLNIARIVIEKAELWRNAD